MQFVANNLGIVVSQDAVGSITWSGDYEGKVLRAAVPLEGGERCVLLLDPNSGEQPAFENLLCIDKGGCVLWIAKLPEVPDTFVRMMVESDVIIANTWSGFLLKLEMRTGKELERVFVK